MIRILTAKILSLGLIGGLLAAPAFADDAPKPKPAPIPIVVDITLKGALGEDPSPIGLDGEPIGENLKGFVDRLAKAKADTSVKALVLRVRTLSAGWAKVNEVRVAIKDFRASGKKVYAVLEGAGNLEYIVATAADEIVLPESDWLMIKGLAAQVTF